MTSSFNTADVIPGLELALESPLPPKVRNLIDTAVLNGWEHNFTSMVTRWFPNGEAKYGLPWFAAWHLHYNAERSKWSWRFAGAMARNGQKLNLADAMLYLEHPEVIYPQPPRPTQAERMNSLREKSG